MHLKKKTWDVADIVNQIQSLSRQCNSPYNDGFTAFGCKQDLHLIKEAIDAAFETAPNFGELEKDWLTELEKKRIIKILKS
jgi:hypothetical protein